MRSMTIIAAVVVAAVMLTAGTAFAHDDGYKAIADNLQKLLWAEMAKVSELESQVNATQSENDRLDYLLNQSRANHDTVYDKYKSLLDENRVYRNQIKNLESRVEGLHSSWNEDQRTIQQQQDKIAKLQNDKQELKDKVKKLNKRVDALKEKRDVKNEKIEDIMGQMAGMESTHNPNGKTINIHQTHITFPTTHHSYEPPRNVTISVNATEPYIMIGDDADYENVTVTRAQYGLDIIRYSSNDVYYNNEIITGVAYMPPKITHTDTYIESIYGPVGGGPMQYDLRSGECVRYYPYSETNFQAWQNGTLHSPDDYQDQPSLEIRQKMEWREWFSLRYEKMCEDILHTMNGYYIRLTIDKDSVIQFERKVGEGSWNKPVYGKGGYEKKAVAINFYLYNAGPPHILPDRHMQQGASYPLHPTMNVTPHIIYTEDLTRPNNYWE